MTRPPVAPRGRALVPLAGALVLIAVAAAAFWFLRGASHTGDLAARSPGRTAPEPSSQEPAPPTRDIPDQPAVAPERIARMETADAGSWAETAAECFRGIDRNDGSIVLIALLHAARRTLLEAPIQPDSLDLRRHDDGLSQGRRGQRTFTLVDGTSGNNSACVSEYGQGPEPAATSEVTVSWVPRGWRSTAADRERKLPYFQVKASLGADPESPRLTAAFDLECTVEEESGAPPTTLRYSASFTEGKGTGVLEQSVERGPRTSLGLRPVGTPDLDDAEIAAAARELLQAFDQRLQRILAGVPRQ